MIGVSFGEAQETLSERGYILTGTVGGWSRYTTLDGRSILVKPGELGKVTAAYPDHASTAEVEKARVSD